MEDKCVACALHKFDALDETELSLTPGDVVVIVSQVNKEWIKGEKNFKQGLFPANHTAIHYLSQLPPPPFYIALLDAKDVTFLPYKEGDVLKKSSSLSHGLARGCIYGSSEVGIFSEEDCVEFLANAFLTKTEELGSEAVAIANVSAQIDEEMSVTQGDLLKILHAADDVFYMATFNNKKGLVPKYAVRLLRDREVKRPTSIPQKRADSGLKKPGIVLDLQPGHRLLNEMTSLSLRGEQKLAQEEVPDIEDKIQSVANKIFIFDERFSISPTLNSKDLYQLLCELDQLESIYNRNSGDRKVFYDVPRLQCIRERFVKSAYSPEEPLRTKNSALLEMIDTETSFFEDMTLLNQSFDPTIMKQQISPQHKEVILGNLDEICRTSEKILNKIKEAKESGYLDIGVVILDLRDDIFKVYSKYVVNYDSSIRLLQNATPEITQFVQEGMANIRVHNPASFDLSSFIMKPVQRLMKYPLLLTRIAEVYSPEDERHSNCTNAAVKIKELIEDINEQKRFKEISDRYLSGRTESIVRRDTVEKALHDISKKAKRMTTSLKLIITDSSSIPPNMELDMNVEKFNKLKSIIDQLQSCIKTYKASILKTFTCQNNFAKSVLEVLRLPMDENLSQTVQSYLRLSLKWTDEFRLTYIPRLDDEISQPLKSLMELCDGPRTLLVKRKSKQLDYERFLGESKKAVETGNMTRTLEEQTELAQKIYMALDRQLSEDLPKFNQIAFRFLTEAVAMYLAIAKEFSSRYLSQLVPLKDECEGIYEEIDDETVNRITAGFCTRLLEDLSGLGFDFRITDGPPDLGTPQSPLTNTSIFRHGSSRNSQSFINSWDPPPNARNKVNSISSSSTLPRASRDRSRPTSQLYERNNEFYETVGTIGRDQPSVRPPLPPLPPPYSNPNQLPVYEVLYDFIARSQQELTIQRGQQVLELAACDEKGNQDWKLVENQAAMKGYVPANYVRRVY